MTIKTDQSPDSSPLEPEERALGMNQDITRRDFLGSTALGVGTALLGAACPSQLVRGSDAGSVPATSAAWTGYGGVGDYAVSNGNTWDVVSAAHAMRDGQWSGALDRATSTGEVYDLVVVGGGFSGIGSAYFFNQFVGPRRCLILDNHLVAGGEAKRNEFFVRGQRLIGPQGSNNTDFPDKDPGWYGKMWRDLGLPSDAQYGQLDPSRRPLTFAPDNYSYQLWADDFDSHGFFFSEPQPHWVRNPWGNALAGTPWPAEVRRDLLRWRNEPVKPFAGTQDQMVRWLDTMTYEQYLTRERGLHAEVARYADPILASAAGLGSDVMSAYAAYYDELPGFQGLGRDTAPFSLTQKLAEQSNVHSFPGGNDAILRSILKSLIPNAITGSSNFVDVHNGALRFEALDRADNVVRLRSGSTVVTIADAAQSKGASKMATVIYARGGRLHSVQARTVIVAAASWTAKHIVSDLPHDYLEAMSRFPRSPMLVANVALNNWRFLYKLGYTACSWRGGIGYTANIRSNMYIGDYRPPLDPDRPNLMTFYIPFDQRGLPLEQQGPAARAKMLATSYREYERAIRGQMVKMFGMAGFDPERDIAGIVLNRWGHAYVNAGPGFYYGRDGRPAPRDVLRQPLARLAFAHSELEGNQNWMAAISEARRAAQQVSTMV